MNGLQKALYDYTLNSSCEARGAANELVKKFGVHDFYTTDLRALASECGSWILEPIDIAQNEMYENGYTDIAKLSKSELREVAEEVMSYLFTKKRERENIMKMYTPESRINIDKIITEAIGNAIEQNENDLVKHISVVADYLDKNNVEIGSFIIELAAHYGIQLPVGGGMSIASFFEPKKKTNRTDLVNAIKNASTFYNTTGGFLGEESGEAKLSKPIKLRFFDFNGHNGIAPINRIGYGIEKEGDASGVKDDIYFYGYGLGPRSDDSYVLFIEPKEIEEIIKLIV